MCPIGGISAWYGCSETSNTNLPSLLTIPELYSASHIRVTKLSFWITLQGNPVVNDCVWDIANPFMDVLLCTFWMVPRVTFDDSDAWNQCSRPYSYQTWESSFSLYSFFTKLNIKISGFRNRRFGRSEFKLSILNDSKEPKNVSWAAGIAQIGCMRKCRRRTLV